MAISVNSASALSIVERLPCECRVLEGLNLCAVVAVDRQAAPAFDMSVTHINLPMPLLAKLMCGPFGYMRFNPLAQTIPLSHREQIRLLPETSFGSRPWF